MSTNDTYLAVFLGGKSSSKMKAWEALSEKEQAARKQEGMAAWDMWCKKHQAAIVEAGGPLGITKKIMPHGTEDASNELCGFMIVRAVSHEAAARMFEKHPHMTVFPGDSVEIMPILPIPVV